MFVVTTSNHSASPNSVSLVVVLSPPTSPGNRAVATFEQLLTAHPADFDIVAVCASSHADEHVCLQRLSLAHPLRMQFALIEHSGTPDGAIMEGIVRAHGRTIVLLKDDTPESLDRFETFMGGLGLAPGLQRHNAGIRTHATRRDPRQATWGTSTASAQGNTTATLGAA